MAAVCFKNRGIFVFGIFLALCLTGYVNADNITETWVGADVNVTTYLEAKIVEPNYLDLDKNSTTNITLSKVPDVEMPFEANGFYKAKFKKSGAAPEVIMSKGDYKFQFSVDEMCTNKTCKNLVSENVKHNQSKIFYLMENLNITYQVFPTKLKEEIVILNKEFLRDIDNSNTLDFKGVLKTDLKIRIGNTAYSEIPEYTNNTFTITEERFVNGTIINETTEIYDSVAFLDENNK